MGAHASSAKSRHRKYDDAVHSFEKEELEKWKQCFHSICGDSKSKDAGFNKDQLMEYTKPVLTDQLQKNLMAAFAQVGASMAKEHEKHHQPDFITLETFIIGISHFLKSDLDEKTNVFAILCGAQDGNVSEQQLSEFLANTFRVYIAAESKSEECKTWNFSSTFPEESIGSLRDFLLTGLNFDDKGTTSIDNLVRWMSSHALLTKMLDLVIYSAFKFDIKRDFHDVNYIPWTIPSCEASVRTLLTAPTLFLLNYHVPTEFRHQWRNLYSTTKDGESFSTLVKQIGGQGPTLMVVQDHDGYVFGGFNSKDWELSSNFLGDESCFVFSLYPNVAIYTASGYNKNFCYLNQNQQTLPNGLGFGCRAQDNGKPTDFFTLWLDHDFGTGRSIGACTTFNSPRLSSSEAFKIRCLEVWSVQSTQHAKKGKVVRSVLDVDPETKAILEMVGKTRHSEGLREPQGKDDEEK